MHAAIDIKWHKQHYYLHVQYTLTYLEGQNKPQNQVTSQNKL